MVDQDLRRWQATGVVATLLIVLVIPLSLVKQQHRRDRRSDDEAAPSFVGRAVCARCHAKEVEAWQGSDHDRAMAVADETSVLGDFDDASFDDGHIAARFFRRDGAFVVATRGPDDEEHDYEVAYTFGVDPLQQYLIPFPGGRLQCLTIAWDTIRHEWFNLYPEQDIPRDDWLHWTRGAQTWNGMCAECHSTNLRKGYDHATRTFATTFSEIDVSCEACHGPASRHVEWAEIPPMARPEIADAGLVITTRDGDAQAQVELCAPCHSRRSELGDYDHSSDVLLTSLVPSLLEQGLYHPDGQILAEVYVYGSFVQSKMYRNDVRCSDCHDVHSLERRAPGNELCAQCHRADVYDSADHHFHKKVYQGQPSDGALCVKCHMPEQVYMIVDWRADHSLRVPRPDLTRELGVPNACSQYGCHDDRPLSWVLESFERWYGRARKPHYGTILAAGRKADPAAQPQLIRLAGDPLFPAIVRATALSLLRSYPGRESVQAFARALLDEDDLVRYTAVLNCTAPTPQQLVELLAPLLFDPVKGVRLQAAARLAGASPQLLKPYQRQALSTGIKAYEQVLEYSLDFAYAGHNLGNLSAALGEPGKAERAYRAAIAVDDLFTPAKVNLATLLNSQGRNAEAETLLREVRETEPDSGEVAYSLGLLLAEMERFEEAEEQLAAAVALMPQRARVLYNLGLVQQRLGQTAQAEATLQRALALEPDNLDLLWALTNLYVGQDNLGLALELANRMIATHPDEEIGHRLKASIEQELSSAR